MAEFTIYNADCLDVMRGMDANSIDAVIMDPPYGIDRKGHHGSALSWNSILNDGGELDLRTILKMSCLVISFGANNYPSQLPHRGRWLVWDKRVNPKADKMGVCPAAVL